MNRFHIPTGIAAVAVAVLALSGCSGSPGAADAPAAGCKPAAEFDTIVKGTLTVAAIQQLPSIDIDVTTGKKTGLDSVILGGFAKENCLKIDWQPLAGPSAVAAMTEGKADVAAGGWYRTEARGEILGQTDPTWYDQVGVVAHGKVSSIGDLKDKKVGIVGGSLFEKPLTEAVGADHVIAYQSIDAIFEDLAANRIDAAMGAGATLTVQVADRDSDLKVSLLKPDADYPELTAPGQPNYPFTKSNTALGDALNAYVQQQRENGVVAKELARYGIDSDFAIDGPKK